MSEELMVRYCSPTLAGIKTGSLFACRIASEEEMNDRIRAFNQSLASKGLRVWPMQVRKQRALIYVYRPKKLRKDFADPSLQMLLRECGYPAYHPERCLVRLIQKLQSNADFPHEIGLFLGYPPEDVRGFIEHRTVEYKGVGFWKVYGDPEDAEKLFAKYRKCTDVYCTQWKKGKSIEKLTVIG